MRHFYLFLLIVSGIVLSGTRMIAQSRPSVGSIRVVSGTIVDENNKAMANIVIYIKGTDIRVISDTDGYFSLPLKDTKDHVLITNSYNTVSAIRDIPAGEGNYEMDIQLSYKLLGLPEVDIVGAKPQSYNSDIANSATRMDIPVMEIPGTVGVATRKLLEDQQATTMTEAIRNLGGVKGGPSGEASNINEVFSSRGFSMTNSVTIQERGTIPKVLERRSIQYRAHRDPQRPSICPLWSGRARRYHQLYHQADLIYAPVWRNDQIRQLRL